jgi:hypothetical protein
LGYSHFGASTWLYVEKIPQEKNLLLLPEGRPSFSLLPPVPQGERKFLNAKDHSYLTVGAHFEFVTIIVNYFVAKLHLVF